ncbi:mediator of RNA polymerase II transcription subunit 15a-like [Phaseolus vulgaris]|uniref:mediator of RNA polymerase II transcription subunit 15a-like n=1 Tax=Phaseolus vulgaris TaxID=3885 RepID=UPI0035CA2820
MKPTAQQTNMQTVSRWKLPEFRKSFMKKCLEGLVKQSGLPLTRLSGVVQHLQRYEVKLNAAANNEVEYCHWLSQKVKEVLTQLMNAESKLCHSNSTASVEVFSAQEAGKSSNIDWKEQAYQKIQKMSSAYFSKVYVSYQQMNRALQQLGSSPQGSNTVILEKLRKKIKKTEFVLALFRMKKCQITTDIQKILDTIEDFIQASFFPKNVSSNQQGGKHLGDEKSRQQSDSSRSSISPLKIIEMKPSQQVLGTQNYHIRKDVSQENKLCLEEQQLKIIETKPSPQVLGTQNYPIWKDVSQQNKICLKEQQVKIIETKSSPQALGTQNYHIWKDVSQQNKICLKEQQVKIIETKSSQQALGTQNYHIWKDVSQQNKICLKEQQVKIIETKPSPQALGSQNYNTWKDVSQQNKICLKEQQVEKQYGNSTQHVNQVSIMKGPDNALQKQAQGSRKATEAFSVSVNSPGISSSPLTENCHKLKEISHKSSLTFDEPSAEVKHLLKVLSHISPEASRAALSEIREVVYLNDVMPTSEFLNGPPKMVQQQNQPGLFGQTGENLASNIEPFSQARYMTCHDFVPTGRKRSNSMNTVPSFYTSRISDSSCHSFNQLSDAEQPDWTSVTCKKKKPRIVGSHYYYKCRGIEHLFIDFRCL